MRSDPKTVGGDHRHARGTELHHAARGDLRSSGGLADPRRPHDRIDPAFGDQFVVVTDHRQTRAKPRFRGLPRRVGLGVRFDLVADRARQRRGKTGVEHLTQHTRAPRRFADRFVPRKPCQLLLDERAASPPAPPETISNASAIAFNCNAT